MTLAAHLFLDELAAGIERPGYQEVADEDGREFFFPPSEPEPGLLKRMSPARIGASAERLRLLLPPRRIVLCKPQPRSNILLVLINLI